jgi:outer membrane biosynthesis protein TonB
MPSLPDIPGKSLISGMTNRTKVVVATAGAGALAVGGLVAKRVLGGSAPEPEPDPKPKEAKPKPPKAKPKPKPAKPKPPKAKAEPKEKAAKPKPAAKAKPKAEPAKPAGGKDPHAELNNPVVDDPDLSEYPDPYDTSGNTDELPLQVDPEVENGGKPPRRDNLDD